MKKLVIVGNGIAGTTLAKKIRSLNSEIHIQMITAEKYPFYMRWLLNEYIAGEKSEQELFLYPDNWYEQNKIDIAYNTSVKQILPSEKKIICDSAEYSYDALVIASGAHCWKPPIPGAENPEIFTLRTLDDAKAILKYIDEHRVNHICHIGGGILGLELSYALKKRGVETVTVVEFAPYLLSRQLDEDGAQYLQKDLEDRGLSFYTGFATKSIEKIDDKFIISSDSQKITCDMVIISAGVRPNIDFAIKSGIECERGIKVNSKLQTNIEDIYAIGDCAEYNGMLYGIIPPAQEQADILAKILVGENIVYNGSVMQNTLKIVGIDLTSAGEINPKNKSEYEIVVKKGEKTYKKAVLKNNKLVGLILYGDNSQATKLLKLMKTKATVEGKSLFD